MYQLQIIRTVGGAFDVSELVHDISYTTSISGQPGKLTFQMEKEPKGVLSISVGDMIVFKDGTDNVFKGYVFTMGTDRTETYEVTAYDSTRYLQNHDYFYLDGETNKSLNDIFTKICSQMQLTSSIVVPATQTLQPYLFIDKSYFEMLDYCMTEVNTMTEKQYFIRDRFGTVELNEVETNYLKTFGANPIVIGEDSLLTDYKYEVDIDKDTYNEVYLMESAKSNSNNTDKEKTEKRIVLAKQSESTIKKWGTLRRIINVKEQATEQQLEDYAKLCLSVGAKSTKSMRVEALGYPIYAGDGFRLWLDRLGVNLDVYIMSATHNYGDIHTMTLDVSTCKYFPETL